MPRGTWSKTPTSWRWASTPLPIFSARAAPKAGSKPAVQRRLVSGAEPGRGGFGRPPVVPLSALGCCQGPRSLPAVRHRLVSRAELGCGGHGRQSACPFSPVGRREGRDPGPCSNKWYLNQNLDVEAARPNPVLHFLRWGAARKLKPIRCSPKLVPSEVPGRRGHGRQPFDPLSAVGRCQGTGSQPTFDTDWYLARYPEVAAAGVNPLLHFVRWGATRRLSPGPSFDTNGISTVSGRGGAGINPLAHFLEWGLGEGREPVSPIPQIFERFATKPTISAAEFERIRQIYTSPLESRSRRQRQKTTSRSGWRGPNSSCQPVSAATNG